MSDEDVYLQSDMATAVNAAPEHWRERLRHDSLRLIHNAREAEILASLEYLKHRLWELET